MESYNSRPHSSHTPEGIEQTISHPIQIEAVNVCELWRPGKLSSLTLAELKEVCRSLSLQTNGSNSRKRTFTKPLDAYAKLCSCRE